MLPPKPRLRLSLSLVADKCKTINQLKQIHAQMILTSRINDPFAVSRLISFSALSNNLSYATRIFESTPEPNTFMYNTLIRAHAKGLNPTKALALFVKMRVFGVSVNRYTYPFVLKACGILRSLRSSKQVHCDVLKHGVDSDCYVANACVRSYCLSGDLGSARRVFDEIGDRDSSLWTTMICGYAQNYFLSDALLLFDRMVSEGFEPNEATLASVLSACAHLGCLELGQKIHAFMEEKSVEVGVILGTALVHMYAKNGAISMAMNLFRSMQERNVATWNAVICGLASHGHGEEAISLFHELEKESIVPNDATFVGVLSACCHAGLVKTGREMFSSMKMVYGIEPKIEHYGCMVDLLGRNGELLEAVELIKGMPFKADVVIWGALLSACQSQGNVEVAERVAKEMLALQPSNHGVYVVLSNIYADAGRWKDIERLRRRMKRRNLIKTPGWSFVDGDD